MTKVENNEVIKESKRKPRKKAVKVAEKAEKPEKTEKPKKGKVEKKKRKPRPNTSWNEFIKANYEKVKHLPNKQRFAALSKMRNDSQSCDQKCDKN